MTNPYDEWEHACTRAIETVCTHPDHERVGELAIDMAEDLRALAHSLRGVACSTCSGYGRRMYSSTATWRGGMGGAAMTVSVCDKCWGTGRSDRSGPDLRKMEAALHDATRKRQAEDTLLHFSKRIGATLESQRGPLRAVAEKLRRVRMGDFWAARAAEHVALAIEDALAATAKNEVGDG